MELTFFNFLSPTLGGSLFSIFLITCGWDSFKKKVSKFFEISFGEGYPKCLKMAGTQSIINFVVVGRGGGVYYFACCVCVGVLGGGG